MKAIVAAIHGIMTGQTDPGWPDRFEAWLFNRDPEIHVVKRLYAAGPFPRWNNWVKDPRLAQGLFHELMLLPEDYPIWLVAHSNGAVIALLTAERLIKAGRHVAGMILTGAAIEADVRKNEVLHHYEQGELGAAIAYSSEDDEVVAGDASAPTEWYWRCRDWTWGKLMWPYGSLGRTGWRLDGRQPRKEMLPSRIFTRWFSGGHSCYFAEGQIGTTFEAFYQDLGGAA